MILIKSRQESLQCTKVGLAKMDGFGEKESNTIQGKEALSLDEVLGNDGTDHCMEGDGPDHCMAMKEVSPTKGEHAQTAEGGDATIEPHKDMEFESEAAAYYFYNTYARRMGFSIRTSKFYRSKKDGSIVNRRFVCSKEGFRRKSVATKIHRRITRENCKAMMSVKKLDSGVWLVKQFIKEHSHPLANPSEVCFLRSHRHIQDNAKDLIRAYKGAGASNTQVMNVLRKEAGGDCNVGFTRKDLSNFVTRDRHRSLGKDAQMEHRYFKHLQKDHPDSVPMNDLIKCLKEENTSLKADLKAQITVKEAEISRQKEIIVEQTIRLEKAAEHDAEREKRIKELESQLFQVTMSQSQLLGRDAEIVKLNTELSSLKEAFTSIQNPLNASERERLAVLEKEYSKAQLLKEIGLHEEDRVKRMKEKSKEQKKRISELEGLLVVAREEKEIAVREAKVSAREAYVRELAVLGSERPRPWGHAVGIIDQPLRDQARFGSGTSAGSSSGVYFQLH
ncbi:uncharacterized protein LOC131240331 isoform X2 [Magnolia sinica]|uniref:uncharacterized protein LOC131240331 isoform X2 n=1 Tax=Magnolia sinica TaxID=86752 RepID=UPI00265AA68E|nr:uncharacterized protein LOC131240331 isoform X2 [Magnolia sinica]XP_058094470.1 uncharacterized protein LOC131240331 isoform X2 [Magnolia sinica]